MYDGEQAIDYLEGNDSFSDRRRFALPQVIEDGRFVSRMSDFVGEDLVADLLEQKGAGAALQGFVVDQRNDLGSDEHRER